MKALPRTLSIIIAISSLLTLCGCSFIIQPVYVPNRSVDQWNIVDPNDYHIQSVKHENGSNYYKWNLKPEFDEENQTVPYWSRKSYLNPATVKGQLNGKTYPVVFDTGNSISVFIEDIQINRHDLGVIFFHENNKQNSDGLAIANSLKAGPLEFENFPCSFKSHHPEYRLFGLLPIHRLQMIVMPLGIMSELSYIQYDQINKELVVSPESIFVPEDKSEWISFPFEINDRRILLKTEIEGLQVVLFLDTGADYGLELNQTIVEELFEKRPDFKKARKQKTILHTYYEGIEEKVEKFNATNLHIADYNFDNVNICYGKNSDSKKHFPYKGTDGTIGIELFQKTVMVLDFENRLMWVKKR